MRKFILGFSFFAAATAWGQVGWGLVNAPISGSFYNNFNAPGVNWFQTNGSGGGLNVSTTSEANFYGFDNNDSNLDGYADFVDDGDTGSFSSNGGNLQIGFVNNTGSTISVSPGTYRFSFHIPATTSGFVTGYTVTEDDNSIAGNFAFSFNGFGGLNVTQMGGFNVPGLGGFVAFSVDFTAPSAVPEPAQTGLAFALAGLLAVCAGRRRRS